MRVLVAYYSETGNTEKIAKAIYEEASKDHEAHLKKIEEITADTLNNYDVVFLGSPCHSADLAAPVKRILDTIPKSPQFKLAGFFTHSTFSPDDRFERASELFNRWAGKCIVSFENVSEEKQIDFKGYYNCQGAPSPPIEEFIKREVLSTDEWEEYIEELRKRPSPEDVQKAKEFAREVLSKP
ncbi:MAG: flavodoxin family protein [Candidatus Bathyarchaeia archaeon]